MKVSASLFDNVKRATLSNCGNTLKLSLPNTPSNRGCGGANSLRYGKNVKDWAIRSQTPTLDKEERSSTTKWQWGG